ncbi:MAG: exodeoxyribonuclease VII small subunit [Desulfuromonadaceae bacterium]|jgi:exodeoxyribonuclease VII small subunit|nr:exodeoxyribonuclease VII small subunit [Desulfuromonadaceae bacterium]
MAKETFEKALSGLEKAVENLEKEDLSLEEALRWFEQGVERLALCRKALQEAENKIEVLLKERNGHFKTRAFDTDTGDRES